MNQSEDRIELWMGRRSNFRVFKDISLRNGTPRNELAHASEGIIKDFLIWIPYSSCSLHNALCLPASISLCIEHRR
jgi:hypothetical protein